MSKKTNFSEGEWAVMIAVASVFAIMSYAILKKI